MIDGDTQPEAAASAGRARPAIAKASAGTCAACNRSWGEGIACQFCRQVDGMPVGVALASAGRRLGGFLMEIVLLIVTLIIGYLIWTLIVWSRGQTPGKQVLHMTVVKLREGTTAGWGTMLLREVIAKGIIGLIGVIPLIGWVIVYFWLVWDENNQELWDKLVGTIVVVDKGRLL